MARKNMINYMLMAYDKDSFDLLCEVVNNLTEQGKSKEPEANENGMIDEIFAKYNCKCIDDDSRIFTGFDGEKPFAAAIFGGRKCKVNLIGRPCVKLCNLLGIKIAIKEI